MTKVLITGITGSAGSYLKDYLQDKVKVYGTSRKLNVLDNKNIHQCDLMDFSAVYKTLKNIKPDYIFHLAANADIKMSFSNPLCVLNNNVSGTANLLEAIHILGIDTNFQMCSTSEVYGKVTKEDTPIKETQKINPVNVYSVAKLTQERLALAYHYMYGMKVVVTRAFSYINPRRKDIFSTAFAIQIAQIELGLKKILSHGNLESIRTLLDVRDIVEAYWQASQLCENGECYNIGSMIPISVGDFLNVLITKANVKIITKKTNVLQRPIDITLQIPDTKKFVDKTNWKPKYDYEDSINYLLKYCRENYV